MSTHNKLRISPITLAALLSIGALGACSSEEDEGEIVSSESETQEPADEGGSEDETGSAEDSDDAEAEEPAEADDAETGDADQADEAGDDAAGDAGEGDDAETVEATDDFELGVLSEFAFEAPGTETISEAAVLGTQNVHKITVPAEGTLSVDMTSVEDNAVFGIIGYDLSNPADEVTTAEFEVTPGEYTITVSSTLGNATYDMNVVYA